MLKRHIQLVLENIYKNSYKKILQKKKIVENIYFKNIVEIIS
jgi:hypothetical protein